MRVAAAIYLASCVTYAVGGVYTVISAVAGGLPIRWLSLLLMGVFAASLLYFAYALFRATTGARWGAIFVSACFVAACCVVLFGLYLPIVMVGPARVPLDAWLIISVFVAVCVAHAAALLLLLFARPPRPNLPLNPDAPSAGARSNILARPPFRRAG